MTQVSIYVDGTLMLKSEVHKLSTLGFDCEIPLTQVASLRDDTGRIQTFEFDIQLGEASEAHIHGQVSIHSVRRVAQTLGVMTTRFLELTPECKQYLAEYLNTGKVVSFKAAQQKRRA